MGYLKYVKKAFSAPSKEQEKVQRERLIAMRKDPVTVRLARPTNLSSARALGYKPKQGIIVVRQRIARGGHTRQPFAGGRVPKKNHHRLTLRKNYQQLAEERASKGYANCEILGSYLIAQDGKNYWYEIVLIDRHRPQVLADTRLQGIALQRGRAQRGVTSAGKRSRGLRKKGIGSEKTRPSRRANQRQG